MTGGELIISINMSILVLILQYYTKEGDKNIDYIRRAFNSSTFITEVIKPPPPPSVTITISQEQYVENYNNLYLLEYSNNNYPDLPVIIIYDNSVSNITGDGMSVRILNSINQGQNVGLIYLCKWNDYCNKYKTLENYIDGGSSLKYSQSPNGLQCILYKQGTRNNIIMQLSSVITTQYLGDLLLKLIGNGAITAAVFSPNIVDFDINLSLSNSDFSKLNECIPISDTNDKNVSVAPLLWFWIIVLLIIVVGWALIVIGPKPKRDNVADS